MVVAKRNYGVMGGKLLLKPNQFRWTNCYSRRNFVIITMCNMKLKIIVFEILHALLSTDFIVQSQMSSSIAITLDNFS